MVFIRIAFEFDTFDQTNSSIIFILNLYKIYSMIYLYINILKIKINL